MKLVALVLSAMIPSLGKAPIILHRSLQKIFLKNDYSWLLTPSDPLVEQWSIIEDRLAAVEDCHC
jgi:hypothetical protein